MDIRKIKKLIELITESDIEEIEIKEADETIRISRRSQQLVSQAVVSSAPQTTQIVAPESSELKPTVEKSTLQTINAPMVGTFYRAPSPESPPFVQVGQNIKEGDVICIIEAMKMMNQIEADRSGVIQAINATDGEPVEFDQALITIA